MGGLTMTSNDYCLICPSARKEQELHVLFNNACVSLPLCKGYGEPTFRCSGIMGGPIEQLTVDGYDMTWGTNTLGNNFPIVNATAFILSIFYN